MPAIKSDCPTRAEINRHFVISYEVQGEKGSKLIGAGKYESLVGEKLKIKHFNEVLSGKRYQYTFKIRNRLTIKFRSK
ncbi:hypothetical protein [Flavobacterium sp. CAU 1735]|uniref:hypothetical protein n=1 Tax=Flavobacterium sp. CAU 1735 TaxID=3140361 RepID=UPI00326016A8